MTPQELSDLMDAAKKDSRRMIVDSDPIIPEPESDSISETIKKTAALRDMWAQCGVDSASKQEQEKLAAVNHRRNLAIAKYFAAMDVHLEG